MNCDEFAAAWRDLVTDSVTIPTKNAMRNHAAECEPCGKRWKTQQLVEDTMQELVTSDPLPTNMAAETADELYQEKFGTAVDFRATSSQRVGEFASSLGSTQMISKNAAVMFALGAALLGYLFGNGGGANKAGSAAMMQQLYSLNAYGRGGGNAYEVMMMNNLMGGTSSGGIFPAVSATVKTACLIAVLLWLTRSRLWNSFFPSKRPGGLKAARWFGLIAALVGIARCVAHAYVSYTLMSMTNRGGSDSKWFLGTLSAVDQLWSIAFWLTIVVLATTVIDRVAVGTFAPGRET